MAAVDPDLELDIGISLRRMQGQLNQLYGMVDKQTRATETRFVQSNQRIAKSFAPVQAAARNISGVNGLRGIGLQLNQVAQQGAITGQYLTALAIQMPDILLAFGTFGILAGAAAAALIPLAATLSSTGDSAKALEDRMKSLSEAIRDLKAAQKESETGFADLFTDFGADAGQVKEIFELRRALAEVRAEAEAFAAARTLSEGLFGGIADRTQDELILAGRYLDEYRARYQEIIEEINQLATQPQTGATEARFLQLQAEQQEIDQFIAATQNLQRQLAEITNEFDITTMQAGELAAAVVAVNDASTNDELVSAVRELRELLFAAAAATGEVSDETRTLLDQLLKVEEATLIVSQIDLADPFRRAADEAARLFENMRRTSSLEYGKIQNTFGSGPDAARSEVLFQDRPDAPQPTGAGLPTKPVRAAGGAGRKAKEDPLAGYDPNLLAAIAARVAEVTAEIKALEEANQKLEGAVGSAFVSLVTGAESARGALRGLLEDLARLFAQVGFQNLVTGVGGFGQLGNLLKTFDGGGFTGMGPRAGGIDGKGGFPAILHPNETVLDHTRGQGGNPVSVVVNIDAKGAQDSGRGAMAAVPQIRAAIVAAMNDANRRGYR